MVRSRFGERATLLLVSLIPTLLGPAVPAAHAAALSWNSVGGGAAAAAANWNPVQVPTAADDLVFNLNNMFTVTYNASVPSARTHTYRRGVVTFAGSSPHTASSGLTIGDLAGDVSTLSISSGLLTSNAAVVVGDAAGATGTLNINDHDADLVLTTNLGDLLVGNSGAGTLSITGGGLVEVSDRLLAAGNNGSTGSITVSGFTTSPISRSTLVVNGTSQFHTFGGGGDCTVAVSNGALVDIAGSTNVAGGTASDSTVTIGGAGASPATMLVGGTLRVAGNTATPTPGGNGTVTVNSDGVLDVVGPLELGFDPDGATGGTLVVNGTGLVECGGLTVGEDGVLQLNGGVLEVIDGPLAFLNPNGFVLGGSGLPILRLTGPAASAALTTIAGTRALTIAGGPGAVGANVELRQGADLSTGFGHIVIGEGSSDNGSLIASDSGTTITMPPGENLVIGQGGSGVLSVRNGAALISGNLFTALNAGSTGVVDVESPGTTVEFGAAAVGGSMATPGGTGVLTVESGALFTSQGSLRVWPGSALNVLDGATLECAVNADLDGLIDLSASTISVGGTLQLDGDMQASGTIDGRVQVGAAGLLTTTGDLAVGDSSSISGFSSAGEVRVEGGVLTIHDANRAVFSGTLQLVSDRDVVADNGITVTSAGVIAGNGDVFADVDNSGLIQTSGIKGIRFRGLLNGFGQGINGTAIRFMDGGGFTGAGTFGAGLIVHSDADTTITATGALTMGSSGSSGGFICDGALNVGSNTVTLRDANTADFGGPVLIAGGNLQSTNGIRLTSTGSITGSGQVGIGRFISDAGSVIAVPFGDLSLGDPNALSGVNLGGELHVGTSTVSLRSLTDVELGTLTTITGGVLNGPSNPFNPFDIVNLHLSAGDVIQGFGTINDFVSGDAGAAIIATGPLQLFGTLESFPVIGSFDGTLAIGPYTVGFSGPASLGGAVTLLGGTLEAGSPGLTLQESSDLSGFGLVVGGAIGAHGTISPGGAGSPTGVLAFFGQVTMSPTTVVNIDIGGRVSGTEYDRIDATAPPTTGIGGTLNVQFINGFEPVQGDSFVILNHATRTGEFATFNRPDLAGRYLQIYYHSTFIRILVRANQIGDLDCDGDADFFDIDPFVAALNGEGPYLEQFPNCDHDNADADCDGDVDFFDIDPFVGCLGGNCTCQ